MEAVQRAWLLHTLNHVIKSRARVIRHNTRRAQAQKAARLASINKAVEEDAMPGPSQSLMLHPQLEPFAYSQEDSLHTVLFGIMPHPLLITRSKRKLT
jgi:hypothetical protein